MASTTVDAPSPEVGAAPHDRIAFGPLAVAGAASLGAGAIHAAAVGSHSEHPQTARAFLALAACQVVWGALALRGRHRLLAPSGIVISATAIGGWIAAKTVGIGFIEGLGVAEDLQRADILAMGLAVVALVVTLRIVLPGRPARTPGRSVLGVAAIAVSAVSLIGMDGASAHLHAGGHDDAASAVAADGHGDHTGGAAKAAATDDPAGGHGDGHSAAASVAAVPYDPAKPIDLGGVDGVTAAQQARAENLVAITLIRLPHFADYKVAEAAGYHTINDGGTGHEHFINWSYIKDDQVLNPDVPEALVYEIGPGGSRTLVSAMFMLSAGTTLDDVPDVGGALTQWHIHDDLCFSDDPVAPFVAGVTRVGGTCRPPTVKLDPVPMIHVWITKHPCGPFAALEGIGAGQVKAGETKACDEVHGA